MKKVSFILVPSYSKSEWLNDKMLQITEAFINILNVENYPIHNVKEYKEINNFLDQYDYLVVATAGTIIIERDHIWKKIKNIDNEIGIIANLMQHENETPWMHEQFFIINTKAFTELDFSEGKFFGYKLCRSTSDIHEGHAPLYITLGKQKIERHDKFGTKLFEHCLGNGYSVVNWDEDWRYPSVSNKYICDVKLPSRGYCYPKRNTEKFEYALRNLKLVPDLDEAQKMFMDACIKSQSYNVVNAWHYEDVEHYVEAETVIAPATGFLAETLAFKSKAKNIVFYDKNKNNIEFKKKLYKEWNGENYEEFVNDFAKQKQISVEPTLEIDTIKSQIFSITAKDQIISNWLEWKNSRTFTFKEFDCVTQTDELLKYICGSTVVHTSTIFTVYPFTFIIYDKEQILEAKQKLINAPIEWIQA